jgi:hypothetical protein
MFNLQYTDFFPGFFNDTYGDRAERVASLEAYAASRIDEGLLELSGNVRIHVSCSSQ